MFSDVMSEVIVIEPGAGTDAGSVQAPAIRAAVAARNRCQRGMSRIYSNGVGILLSSHKLRAAPDMDPHLETRGSASYCNTP